jgi:hypothetical protein
VWRIVVIADNRTQKKFQRGATFFEKVFERKIASPSTPIPAFLFTHFQARQQRDQFLTTQGGASLIAVRPDPAEAAAFESFGATPKAAAIPE